MVRPVPVVRRQADPLVVQKLWEAISSVRAQKQVANMERLTRYVAREYQFEPEEVERQLNLAVADQLISLYKAVALKGTNPGNEQDGYRVQPPEESERMGDHDWYCYDCHRPGPVLECSECWRVFHQTCTDDDGDADNEDTFICAVCKDVRKQSRVKRKELNRLLGFTVQHLKDRLRELPWFHGQDTGVERFVYHYVDFTTMEAKTESRKYKYLEQFYADARTILHNVFVCFGDSGTIPDLARLMIRDCRYDLDEIRQCKDCYYHSNMRLKDWFCQPCRPPHELVYAKQKGFSYWPAKVIKVTQEGYDVRFFGGLHQRALIAATSIKPLDASPKTLALKRTVGFVKASKELSRHQDLLKHATSVQQQDEDNQSGIENDLDDELDKNDYKVTAAVKRPKTHHKKLNKRRRVMDDSSSRVSIASSFHSTEDNHRSHRNSFEDSYLVTSSEDRVRELSSASTSDGGFKTSRRLSVTNARRPHKSTQTDSATATTTTTTDGGTASSSSSSSSSSPLKVCLDSSDSVMTRCSCDAKRTFDSLKTQLDKEYLTEKNKALKALEEKLIRDFEEDKQRAISRTVAQAQRDIEAARKQTEDKCKSDFSDELIKLNHKHKAEISSAKKKQWCYNCEEEAMYHCCWNTSYCSIKCQQDHWHIEHKRMCRRKRN